MGKEGLGSSGKRSSKQKGPLGYSFIKVQSTIHFIAYMTRSDFIKAAIQWMDFRPGRNGLNLLEPLEGP